MSVIYKGTNGRILVDNLILSDKVGTGECQIRAVSSGAWIAKGFTTEYAKFVSASDVLFRSDSGKNCSNDGAGQIVQVTLPNPLGPGVTFTFMRISPFGFRVKPQGTDAIKYTGGQMADGEWLELASDGAILELVSDDDSNWVATNEQGTLTEQTP
jgi:hypothetical protein